MDGPEQHVERDVVTDETDTEAEGRRDPRVLEQRPREHLHDTDDEPEVDAAAAHEGHGVVAEPTHELVEFVLVADQRGDREVLDVDEPVEVGPHLVEHLLHDLGVWSWMRAWIALRAASGSESHRPGRICSAMSREISSTA